MAEKQFSAETDLAKPVVAWLQQNLWDVYQEVELRTYGSRADIVARQDFLIWAVECKLVFSTDLIEQAIYWKARAHFISVAVPKTKSGRPNLLVRICRDNGIGIIEVSRSRNRWPSGSWTIEVKEILNPLLNRRADAKRTAECLHEEQKTFAAAGNNSGSRWTPFQQTCKNLAAYVASNPGGVTFKEAVQNLKHHYSSNSTAIACLRKWVEHGSVKGVRIESYGKKLILYPSVAEVPRGT